LPISNEVDIRTTFGLEEDAVTGGRKVAETFEEKYEDVLQNIEFALVQVYREHKEMTDWEARDAVNALIRTYKAELRGRTAPSLQLKPLVQKAYDSVQGMCEWRLGREHMVDENKQPVDLEMKPQTVDEIIACLQRVLRSIELWQKEGGRRGYFNFVSQFVQ